MARRVARVLDPGGVDLVPRQAAINRRRFPRRIHALWAMVDVRNASPWTDECLQPRLQVSTLAGVASTTPPIRRPRPTVLVDRRHDDEVGEGTPRCHRAELLELGRREPLDRLWELG